MADTHQDWKKTYRLTDRPTDRQSGRQVEIEADTHTQTDKYREDNTDLIPGCDVIPHVDGVAAVRAGGGVTQVRHTLAEL